MKAFRDEHRKDSLKTIPSYPFSNAAQFTAISLKLNSYWDAKINTLHINSYENFVISTYVCNL